MPSARSAAARARARGNGAETLDVRCVVITVDGRTFEWWLPLTLARRADIRRTLGMSSHKFLAQFSDPDLDLWATAIWLVRRDAGEDVELIDVLDEYADATSATIDFRSPEDVESEGLDDPEA